MGNVEIQAENIYACPKHQRTLKILRFNFDGRGPTCGPQRKGGFKPGTANPPGKEPGYLYPPLTTSQYAKSKKLQQKTNRVGWTKFASASSNANSTKGRPARMFLRQIVGCGSLP